MRGPWAILRRMKSWDGRPGEEEMDGQSHEESNEEGDLSETLDDD